MSISSQPYDQAPVRKEFFDVVLLKRTASEFTCTPPDFERVPVQASDTIAARSDAAVEAKLAEYAIMGVVPPGVEIEMEVRARQRSLDHGLNRADILGTRPEDRR
jgi:hypothetical protein